MHRVMNKKNRKVWYAFSAFIVAGLLGTAVGFGVHANRAEPAWQEVDHFVQFEAPMLYGWDAGFDQR